MFRPAHRRAHFDSATGPRAVLGSQQPRPRAVAHSLSTLRAAMQALRAEDGSRSAPRARSCALVMVSGTLHAQGGALTFSSFPGEGAPARLALLASKCLGTDPFRTPGSPSPQPSPSGRGCHSSCRRIFAGAVFGRDTRSIDRPQPDFSLSPRERVGARGKRRSESKPDSRKSEGCLLYA